ncbi:MAG TPA: UDP-N-acetylmuramoyl-tripeptide--D-alanyl-D-alanine ligase [Acidimicrobiales bacterium]
MSALVPALAGAIDSSRWHHGLAWVTVALCGAAVLPAGLRWLRVAQREHYLAGAATRFATRWWRVLPVNPALLVVATVAAAASLWWPIAGVATALVVAIGPLGLSLKGRTSALAWTRRLRTLAVVWLVLESAIVVTGVITGPASLLAVVAALAVPLVVDLACLVTTPLEHRLSAHFVDDAAARLARVAPTVVAITGSYGKTSTKGHVAHLVRPTRTVVATPASFNNRAGLARAVNEHLADGTEVFVAEMGTYGPGEIADLCQWCPPDIAVITAIGPVHLERFGSEDRIVEAKSEILVAADDVVLQVDDPRLADLADRAREQGKRVHRCSATDRSADVCVLRSGDSTRVSVYLHATTLVEDVEVPTGVQPSNLACAIAVALVLDVDPSVIGARLADLPSVDHRLQAARAPSGVMILDDTYNANPAGAAEALAALGVTAASLDPTADSAPGRRVVVTPGMVELGTRQFDENRRVGAAIAAQADHLVLVGTTNRRALLAGIAMVTEGAVGVTTVRHRVEAVEWVRAHLTSGDTVLYENDLPDHYP